MQLPRLFIVGWITFCAAWSFASRCDADSGDRPNILCITSEDNSAHWLGCYGNAEAQTPALDALAKDSVVFDHAYSNAPVCAVARSTLLHGAYAVTLGTQHMRSRHPIPSKFRPYVSYLQEQGYYCTNRSKTDYNRLGRDREIWDECSNQAHYKNRQADQPFFAIFNLTVSHESSLFPEKVAKNRSSGTIPMSPRLDAKTVPVPPYLPDLPEVRQDIAIYHDTLTALDSQVAELLAELKSAGLHEDTLVFYFSDHGGPTPRGKRYLTDTGVHVPMIVHIPKKWQHLSPFPTGQRTDELVSFVDLAPTFLSLVGKNTPEQMQGRAFLGEHRRQPPEQPAVFLYADRFDEIPGMRRGITDGQFKYIRRFTPHLPAAPYSYYQLGVPSWAAWQQAWRDGQLNAAHSSLWQAPQPTEELYDLQSDPWEIHNLASDPKHNDHLVDFRDRLYRQMAHTRDTSILPESMFHQHANYATAYDYANSAEFDYERILEVAFAASGTASDNLPQLAAGLQDEDPTVRYWATLGCTVLGKSAQQLQPQLMKLLEDPQATVRITAAQALGQFGRQAIAKRTLLSELDRLPNGETGLLLFHALAQLEWESDVPDAWIQGVLADKHSNKYLRRLAQRLANQRK